MGNPVVHFEVLGKDGPRLQTFFADLFGWKVDANNPVHYGMVDTGGAGGIAGGIGTDERGSGYVTFYVQVEDLAASLERAESLGGRTLMEPAAVPGGPEIALFADPEGHVIGLLKG